MTIEHPRLRPYLAASPEDRSERFFHLYDHLRISRAVLRFTPFELSLIGLLDGSRSVRDLQNEAMIRAGGQLIPLEHLQRLIQILDEAVFLDTPAWRDRIADPIRQPSCVGVYPEDPAALRRQLHGLFTHPKGSGLPMQPQPDPRFRAVLVPHIDYARGGLCYTFGFKELFERTEASLFVIIATSHYSRHRFTLTRKHFRTPLGTVQTDSAFIDRLVANYGDGLFEDELLAHTPQHSVELEVVFLQWLYEGKKEIRIVPLVVGSFHDCIQEGVSPATKPDISRMVAALRQVERETPEPICYVISGDLAHIGPKFGKEELDDDLLSRSLRQDHESVKALEQSRDAFFGVIAKEGDRRRICGLPPTWVTLSVLGGSRGRLLNYDRNIHIQRFESVSFCSMSISAVENGGLHQE